jgi:hypothetical protein
MVRNVRLQKDHIKKMSVAKMRMLRWICGLQREIESEMVITGQTWRNTNSRKVGLTSFAIV